MAKTRSSLRRLIPLFVLVALGGALGGSASGQTGGEPPSPAEEPSSFETLFDQSDMGNVAQTARGHFHAGHRLLVRGDKLVSKAEKITSEAKREDLLEKAAGAYESAVAEYTEAIGFDQDLLPAYAELGLAYRKLGRPLEALQTHVAALKLAPQDEANFRGWADSILALDMLGDATQAYSRLATENPERADYLMSGLKSWLEVKTVDPGDLDPAHVERLAGWIEQQEQGSG